MLETFFDHKVNCAAFEDYNYRQTWAGLMLEGCQFVYAVPDDVGFSHYVWLTTNINSSSGPAARFDARSIYNTGVCEPSQ